MQENTSTRKNRGAIVVEATAVLPIFIFAIYIILSIVDICYVQAKISMALDSAAEDISQYSYLYYQVRLRKVLVKPRRVQIPYSKALII